MHGNDRNGNDHSYWRRPNAVKETGSKSAPRPDASKRWHTGVMGWFSGSFISSAYFEACCSGHHIADSVGSDIRGRLDGNLVDTILAGGEIIDAAAEKGAVYIGHGVLDSHCEFARGTASENLSGDGRVVRYVGFLTTKQMKRTDQIIRDSLRAGSQIRRSTCESAAAAAAAKAALGQFRHLSFKGTACGGRWCRTFPRLADPCLAEREAVWPEALSTRFAEGSDEHAQMMQKKARFEVDYPVSAVTHANFRPTSSPGRVGGLCDYFVDEGTRPLDVTGEIPLAAIPMDEFTEGRLVIVLRTLSRFCSYCNLFYGYR
eukprot:Skav200239  [mRNA]  locus=scaffold3882:71432:74893:+ [translate_table: standard]